MRALLIVTAASLALASCDRGKDSAQTDSSAAVVAPTAAQSMADANRPDPAAADAAVATSYAKAAEQNADIAVKEATDPQAKAAAQAATVSADVARQSAAAAAERVENR